MSGAYWGLTALDLMGHLGDMNVDEIVTWLLGCQHDCGNSTLLEITTQFFFSTKTMTS